MKDKTAVRGGVYIQAKVATAQDGSMDLVLPEMTDADVENLPPVSVVTITKDRGQFAALMLYNWVNIKYPRQKLEWLILDDSSKDAEYDLRDYIPQDDPTIRYVKLDKWMRVDEKRNKAVELAKYDFIVHMDDDDYYFPDHILAKVRLMLHYRACGVHSLPIGVYDMMEGSSLIFDPKRKDGLETNSVAEASLAYRRAYWERNKFVSEKDNGMAEGAGFINKHHSKWVNVHFLFNMISITHTKNVTGNNRRFINEFSSAVKTGNFEDVFPEDFKTILKNIKKMLETKYTRPEQK